MGQLVTNWEDSNSPGVFYILKKSTKFNSSVEVSESPDFVRYHG